MIKECNFKLKYEHDTECLLKDTFMHRGVEAHECNGEDKCILFQIYKVS